MGFQAHEFELQLKGSVRALLSVGQGTGILKVSGVGN